MINGYNPSHVGGLGDITEAAAQTLNSSISSFDLNTILLQIYPQVTTRKLLLVGHSQGAFYANDMYSYLLAHGEPKAAVGVYQVGTPASSVAGGGKYVTSSNDSIINAARLIASNASQGLIPLAAQGSVSHEKPPLPANIELSANGNGHGFSGVYLAEAPERIVSDIKATLGGLEPEWASDTGECFTPPAKGLAYDAAKTGFAVADTAAAGAKVGLGAAQTAAVALGNMLASAAQGAYGLAAKVVDDIGITAGGVAGISHAAEPEKKQTNFDLLKKLYGSSLTKEEYEDYLGNLGSAVATAPVFEVPDAPKVQPEQTQPRITYLGGSHTHRDSAPAPEIDEPVADTADAPTVEDDASSTPEATTTPEIPAEPAYVHGGSPVVDSFDSYDGSGWTTYGGYNTFGSSPGVHLYTATSSPDCHSSGCIIGSTEIGNGGFGNPVRMYKTGSPVAEGSLTIWKKTHTESQGVGNVWVLVCAGAPDAGNKCDGLVNGSIGGSPDVWHEYYLAWRNNGDSKEICTLLDSTDPAGCTWTASGSLSAGDSPDTVVISGDGTRPDLGDRIWFDDLSSALRP